MVVIMMLYALFGLLLTLGKITLFYAHPFFITGAVMFTGGFLTMAYLYASGSTYYNLRWEDGTYYAKSGFFGVFLPLSLQGWGLQYMPATRAACIVSFLPFSTALLAYFLHGERLSKQQITGLIIGLTGMIPAFLTPSSVEKTKAAFGVLPLPELAVVGAVIGFSYNLIMVQQLVKQRSCPAHLASGMGTLIGGFFAFQAALLFERPLTIKNPHIFWPLLVLQIVLNNGVCLPLQANLLKQYSTTFMAFAGLLTSLWATFFGWLLLGEKAYASYFIAFVLVLIGLIIFYYGEIGVHPTITKKFLKSSRLCLGGFQKREI